MIAYKFLRAGGRSLFARFTWPLPERGPGDWVGADVDPCRSGIHACRPDDLPLWVAHALYRMELAGEVVASPGKVVASRGRLLQRVAAWDEQASEDYTRFCAGRAHTIAAGASRPETLAGWVAMAEPSLPEGPALLGFIAASVSEQAHGPRGYREERARQRDWLVERLGL